MRNEDIARSQMGKADITEQDIVWLDIKEAPFVIHGVSYDSEQGRYIRMPQEIADQVSVAVAELNTETAGGRVRFRTDSSFIGIRAVMQNGTLMPHITLAGQSGFDLYRKKDGETKEVFYHTYVPPMGMQTGYCSPFETDGVMAEYTIHFPLYDGVKELYIAVKKDAQLLAPIPYRHPVPVVYYGSSITQGGCASRPGNSYQAIISRQLNVDHINLGFSGSAKAEPAIVEYLAGLEMSVFVCDYDHNTPDAEYLRQTHMPLYRAVRASHPEIPIVFVTAPDIVLRPEAYAERREVIRQTYQTALQEGDKNVYFIDGAELWAGEQFESCTVDGVHPNDFGFYRMAQRIGRELAPLL